MHYIRFTYVDSQTRIPVDQAPARNGPAFPPIPDLEFLFALETEYPTAVPTFYGRCELHADLQIPGVIEFITPKQALNDHKSELRLRVQNHLNATLKILSDPELITEASTMAQQLTDQINQAVSHGELRALQISIVEQVLGPKTGATLQ